MKNLSDSPTSSPYSFFINPSKIARYLTGVIGILLLGNLFNIIVQHNIDVENHQTRLVNQFLSFNEENNFSALFSTLLLFFASIILFFIYAQIQARFRGRKERQWLVLGCIFAFLAMDENLRIHENVSFYAKQLISNDLGGLLNYTWVVPYFILFVAVAAYLMRFVLALPEKTRNLFFLSAFLFVGGAVGFELLEGYVAKHGLNPLYNHIFYTIEELLEMAGVTLFIYALLDYLNAKMAAPVTASPERKTTRFSQEV